MLAAMGDWIIQEWLFASEATSVALLGGAMLLLSGLALLADRRRARRRRIDAVGCMPWTAVFLLSAVCGISLLALAVKGWAGG